jgi:hypothetical protein
LPNSNESPRPSAIVDMRRVPIEFAPFQYRHIKIIWWY